MQLTCITIGAEVIKLASVAIWPRKVPLAYATSVVKVTGTVTGAIGSWCAS